MNCQSQFESILELVNEIPDGQVATYGMIASLLPKLGPRQVGQAMSTLTTESTVPWHRIIGADGSIRPRVGGDLQRVRLRAEAITFTDTGRVRLRRHLWAGQSTAWLESHGCTVIDFLSIQSTWPARPAAIDGN